MNNDSYHKQKDVHKILVRLCTCLESAVISMNVRIATIPTSEQTITRVSNPADSRRVLHLNSLIILAVKVFILC